MNERTEIWHHTQTGEAWAVKVVDDEVAGAAGPLGSTISDLNWPRIYGYLPSAGTWIREHRHLFEAAEPVIPDQ